MKLFRSITLAVILALSLAVIPAAAAPNEDRITMTIIEPISGGSATFTLSGIPVSDGLICSGGVVDNITTVQKRFICSDGSGSFVVDFSINKAERGNVRWSIVGGDGKYAALSGKGSFKSCYYSSTGTKDVYQGSIRFG